MDSVLGTYSVGQAQWSLSRAALKVHAAQHKPELGNKRTKKIEVFLADTAASGIREPSIWWEIEDSPADMDMSMGG